MLPSEMGYDAENRQNSTGHIQTGTLSSFLPQNHVDSFTLDQYWHSACAVPGLAEMC